MSTFVLRREYALQMPNNFVDVDMDEMEYIDGGLYIPNSVISFAVNAVFNGLLGGGTYGSLRAIVNALGKQGSLEVVKGVLKRWVSVQVANKVAGFLGGQIMGFLTFSVGGFVATCLDRYDGSSDGRWTIS